MSEETFIPWEFHFDAKVRAECPEIEVMHQVKDPMGLTCAIGPCYRCDPLTLGKCDWEGYLHAGN